MIYEEEKGVNMKNLLFFLILCALPSCTVNITIADTHGYANDLVDETAKTDAQAEVEVPVKPL